MEHPLIYHHARPLEAVVHGVIHTEVEKVPRPASKLYNLFLKELIGYNPIHLSVGADNDSLRKTGYNLSSRKQVLFSFPGTIVDEGDAGLDWDTWQGAMIGLEQLAWEIEIGKMTFEDAIQVIKTLLAPIYRLEGLILPAPRAVPESSQEVQRIDLLKPTLDLRLSDAIYCKQQSVYAALTEMGFMEIQVRKKI